MQGKYLTKLLDYSFLTFTLVTFMLFYVNRDAEDAITRDGYEFDGYRLRVEFPRGRERGPGGAFISGSRDGRGDRSRGGPPARRSKYRVIVSGK